MRLNFMLLPDPAHSAGVHVKLFGQGARAPMSLSFWFGLKGAFDDLPGQAGLRLAASPFGDFPE
jgi:hypothetical protein